MRCITIIFHFVLFNLCLIYALLFLLCASPFSISISICSILALFFLINIGFSAMFYEQMFVLKNIARFVYLFISYFLHTAINWTMYFEMCSLEYFERIEPSLEGLLGLCNSKPQVTSLQNSSNCM